MNRKRHKETQRNEEEGLDTDRHGNRKKYVNV
jgi:hypothetical protein